MTKLKGLANSSSEYPNILIAAGFTLMKCVVTIIIISADIGRIYQMQLMILLSFLSVISVDIRRWRRILPVESHNGNFAASIMFTILLPSFWSLIHIFINVRISVSATLSGKNKICFPYIISSFDILNKSQIVC
jgi:hypothetical protein